MHHENGKRLKYLAELPAKSYFFEGGRPSHPSHRLVERASEGQALKPQWPVGAVDRTVERLSKRQVLEVGRPPHPRDLLVEVVPQLKALEALRKDHLANRLIEVTPQGQLAEASGPRDPVDGLHAYCAAEYREKRRQ